MPLWRTAVVFPRGQEGPRHGKRGPALPPGLLLRFPRWLFASLSRCLYPFSAACAAARRATGTLKGEQDT